MNGRPNHVHRRNHGFTLIELMVAMLLGLIVIAGVASVFLANLRSYHSNEALSDVQSNSRIAFELMARDIREAGATGCNSTNGRIANVLENGPYGSATKDWWANWGNAVVGYDNDVDGPATTFGNAQGDRVQNTDSLILLGTASTGLSVAEDDLTAANLKLNEKTSDLETGDIIVVCDPDHATIAQITDYNDSNVTLVHNTGSKVSPGNCSKGLGYPTVCTTNGTTYTFGPNSHIAKLSAHAWYVGVNPVGGHSLYRIALDNSGGDVSGTAQEMVRNVQDMQITYHQAADASLGVKFVPADQITNWANVDAVRVTLTLISANPRAGTNSNPIKRIVTSTTTIRNRVS